MFMFVIIMHPYCMWSLILLRSHLKPLNTKRLRYHGIANPGVDFGQTQKCGRAKPADEIDPHPPCLDNWISNGNVNLHRFDSPQKD
jgi:hypothetical protein